MAKYEFVMAAGTWNDVEIEREHLQGRPVTVRLASLATADEVTKETAHVDGIIVTTNPLPRELIARLGPKVRIIGRAGIGLDAIDLEAAKERGVAVYHCPDYAIQEVATHAVALILALNRRIVQGDAIARHAWPDWKQLAPLTPLHAQSVGVIGIGRIGRAVIDRLQPLCREVLAFDPYVFQPPPGARLLESFDDILAQSDVITLHIPLNDETRGMIGARELAHLKPGATIVNVSRGGLIDEQALAQALISGQIVGAGLDVLAEEPPPPSAAILNAPNVILSPHFAWYSTTSERRARTMTIDGMLDYLEGRPQRGGRLAVAPEPRGAR
jgi:D-3-phosphoglycerate dehydrogenase